MRLWKYLSARAIALALTKDYDYPVSEDVVQSWKKKGAADPRAVDRLSDLLGVDMGANRKAPRPEWAEGLESGVAEAVVTRLSGADSPVVIQLEDRLTRLGLLPGAEHNGESTAPPADVDTVQQQQD